MRILIYFGLINFALLASGAFCGDALVQANASVVLSNSCFEEARLLTALSAGPEKEVLASKKSSFKGPLEIAKREFKESVGEPLAYRSQLIKSNASFGQALLITICDQKSMEEQGNCVDYFFKQSALDQFRLVLSREAWHIGSGMTKVFCE